MKKLLSILGTIGLTTTSTTTLISCEKPKPNNNENGGGNKPEPTPESQQPPINSNWKTINGTFNDEFKQENNKWYIMSVRRPGTNNDFRIIKFKNDNIDKPVGDKLNSGIRVKGSWYNVVTSLYRWNGQNDPEIPQIDNNTGKITDWKG